MTAAELSNIIRNLTSARIQMLEAITIYSNVIHELDRHLRILQAKETKP